MIDTAWPIALVLISVLYSYLSKPYSIPFCIIILATFQAASAVNIQSSSYPISISPVILYLVLMMPRMIIGARFWPIGAPPISKISPFIYRKCIRITTPLIFFSFITIIITIIDLGLFSGKVQVINPRDTLGSDQWTMLQPSPSNFSQIFYIIIWSYSSIYCCFTILSTGLKALARCEIALQISLFITVAVSLIQIISPGLYHDYLSPAIHNNISSFQWFDQVLASGKERLSSTFLEPSFYGLFLSSLFPIFFWRCFLARSTTAHLSLNACCLILSGTFIFLCTSSTGIACLIAFTLICLPFLIIVPSFVQRIHPIVFIVAICFLLAALTVAIFGYADTITKSMSEVLTDKLKTKSYDERRSSINNSLSILENSYGLGVGIGSTRPSSFIFFILSATGFVGMGTLIFHVLMIIKSIFISIPCLKSESQSLNPKRLENIYAFSFGWAFICEFFSQCIAIPDINNAYFWIFSFLTLGAVSLTYSDKDQNSVSNSFLSQ